MGNISFGTNNTSRDDDSNPFDIVPTWLWPSAATMSTSRLPSCSDELLDWTEDTTHMFDVFLHKKELTERRIIKQQLQHCNNDELHESNNDQEGVRRGKATTIDSKQQMNHQQLRPQQHRQLNFQPMVLEVENQAMMKELPSMNMIDQAKFLLENIIIVVNRRRDGKSPGVLKIGQFITLHRLLLAYVELLMLMTQQQQESSSYSKSQKPVDYCAICLETNNTDEDDANNNNNKNQNNNMIVLPCTHRLCSTCNEKWTQRRLNCPFCRYEFSERSEVQQCHWEMIEWDTTRTSQDILKDLLRIELRLEKFWEALNTSREDDDGTNSTHVSSEILARTYGPIERTIRILEEDEGGEALVIVN